MALVIFTEYPVAAAELDVDPRSTRATAPITPVLEAALAAIVPDDVIDDP